MNGTMGITEPAKVSATPTTRRPCQPGPSNGNLKKLRIDLLVIPSDTLHLQFMDSREAPTPGHNDTTGKDWGHRGDAGRSQERMVDWGNSRLAHLYFGVAGNWLAVSRAAGGHARQCTGHRREAPNSDHCCPRHASPRPWLWYDCRQAALRQRPMLSLLNSDLPNVLRQQGIAQLRLARRSARTLEGNLSGPSGLCSCTSNPRIAVSRACTP